MKKNLGWTVELRGQEQAVYLARLRDKPPDVFRKGVSLDRPTCLAALEVFLKGNPENYIALDDPKYEPWWPRCAGAKPSPPAKKAAGKRSITCFRSIESSRLGRCISPFWPQKNLKTGISTNSISSI